MSQKLTITCDKCKAPLGGADRYECKIDKIRVVDWQDRHSQKMHVDLCPECIDGAITAIRSALQ